MKSRLPLFALFSLALTCLLCGDPALARRDPDEDEGGGTVAVDPDSCEYYNANFPAEDPELEIPCSSITTPYWSPEGWYASLCGSYGYNSPLPSYCQLDPDVTGSGTLDEGDGGMQLY